MLVASGVRVAGEVSDLLASHHRLSGPRRDPGTLPAGQEVITESHTDKQTSLLGPPSAPGSGVMIRLSMLQFRIQATTASS